MVAVCVDDNKIIELADVQGAWARHRGCSKGGAWHARTHTNTHTHTHTRMASNIHIHTHKRMPSNMHAQIHTRTHIYTRTHAYVSGYKHTQIQTHTPAYAYTHSTASTPHATHPTHKGPRLPGGLHISSLAGATPASKRRSPWPRRSSSRRPCSWWPFAWTTTRSSSWRASAGPGHDTRGAAKEVPGTRAHTQTHTHTHTHVWLQTYTYTRTNACLQTCTHKYTHAHTYTHAHMHTYLATNTHKYKHIRPHTHTHTLPLAQNTPHTPPTRDRGYASSCTADHILSRLRGRRPPSRDAPRGRGAAAPGGHAVSGTRHGGSQSHQAAVRPHGLEDTQGQGMWRCMTHTRTMFLPLPMPSPWPFPCPALPSFYSQGPTHASTS